MVFKKILELCDKHRFLRKIINKDINHDLVRIGPTGALLEENLRNEWFYSQVVNRDNTVFFNKGLFMDTYEYAREMCQGRVSFGIAEVVAKPASKIIFDFDKYFEPEKQCILRTTMFVAPTKSVQVFHQWQRLRRMWWRKFSASPGKYNLTDIQNNKGCQMVEIKADYSWGAHLVESLCLSNEAHGEVDLKNLQVKDGRKKVQACYITSEISLLGMLLNTICDAYDEESIQEESRELLRFHRKLAPYKISFATIAANAAIAEELGQLALYLCRKLRDEHISSLLIPTATKSLESQCKHCDQLGVPYMIILNENTLKNGIAHLRNRETTLKEQVHVSNLPTYVEQIFKNY